MPHENQHNNESRQCYSSGLHAGSDRDAAFKEYVQVAIEAGSIDGGGS